VRYETQRTFLFLNLSAKIPVTMKKLLVANCPATAHDPAKAGGVAAVGAIPLSPIQINKKM